MGDVAFAVSIESSGFPAGILEEITLQRCPEVDMMDRTLS